MQPKGQRASNTLGIHAAHDYCIVRAKLGYLGAPHLAASIFPTVSSRELCEQPFVLLECELRKMDWLTVYLTAGLSAARLLIQQQSPSIESSHQDVPQTHRILAVLGPSSPSRNNICTQRCFYRRQAANLEGKNLIESDRRILLPSVNGKNFQGSGIFCHHR